MNKFFVPKEFVIPKDLVTEWFHMRMLTVQDVHLDYDAVMSSMKHLRNVFGPNNNWPSETMTLEENLSDLQKHQNDFLNRHSFTYTVLRPDEAACLGCVYIDPSNKANYDAEVYLWVRESESKTGFDDILFNAVKKWISQRWPFKNVAYPGKEIPWEQWD
ncbi:MAG: GNAT family N-acetyltransferase [Deltaproteobacteria bacterium]|nr:GNAT family N-acetyltransferase [Deltaproteobacteria bacterium]